MRPALTLVLLLTPTLLAGCIAVPQPQTGPEGAGACIPALLATWRDPSLPPRLVAGPAPEGWRVHEHAPSGGLPFTAPRLAERLGPLALREVTLPLAGDGGRGDALTITAPRGHSPGTFALSLSARGDLDAEALRERFDATLAGIGPIDEAASAAWFDRLLATRTDLGRTRVDLPGGGSEMMAGATYHVEVSGNLDLSSLISTLEAQGPGSESSATGAPWLTLAWEAPEGRREYRLLFERRVWEAQIGAGADAPRLMADPSGGVRLLLDPSLLAGVADPQVAEHPTDPADDGPDAAAGRTRRAQAFAGMLLAEAGIENGPFEDWELQVVQRGGSCGDPWGP